MLDRRKINDTYKIVSEKIKNFLESTKSREFLIFLFFFLVSGGFWLLQTLNDDYEKEFSVPVRLRNVPNDVVITSEPTSELKITVRDKGTVLLNYILSKTFFPVNLDFSDYKGTNNHIRILSTEFDRKVLAQLNTSTRLLSISPDTLEYIYATGSSKQVPVKFQGRATPGRAYYLSDTIFSPDTVLVYAPSPILDTIRNAYIESVNLEDISDTLRQNVRIVTVRGAKFTPASVELILPVDIYTEKTVEVPVYGINFPADRVLRTFPSKVQVTFQVGMSRFKEITADDFALNISYEDLLRAGTDKYTLRLRTIPQGVSNVRISPPQIDFLIEQISRNGN